MHRNSIGYKALSLFLVAAALTACTRSAAPPKEAAAPSASTLQPVANNVPVIVAEAEDDGDWKQQTATVTGANAGVKGNQVLILSAGVYVISGKLDNGQIVVDAQNKGTVRLGLNGAEIHSKDDASKRPIGPT